MHAIRIDILLDDGLVTELPTIVVDNNNVRYINSDDFGTYISIEHFGLDSKIFNVTYWKKDKYIILAEFDNKIVNSLYMVVLDERCTPIKFVNNQKELKTKYTYQYKSFKL